jgi:hypothetical protein
MVLGTLAAGLTALAPLAASAQGGNLAAPPAQRIDLAITGTAPALSQTSFELQTGVYYRMTITSDGAGEFMFAAPTLMPNIHIRLVVINDVEVHLQGQTFRGIEFDGAGEAYFSFVAIVPGEYEFTVGDVTGTFIVQ